MNNDLSHDWSERFFNNTYILLFVGVIIFLSSRLLSYEVSFTTILLLGVWFLDCYLKTKSRFDNDTAFADLSFAVISFIAGRIIEFISTYNLNYLENPRLNNLLIYGIALFFVWIANLEICKKSKLCDPYKRINWHRNFSVLLGIGSFVFTIFQIWKGTI